MANPYDIEDAFEEIEQELIDSMMRNMKRHKAEEDDEGIHWEMWQAMQLEALEKYKKANKKKFSGKFSDINDQIEELIKEANKNGYMDQEIAILKAIKDGFKGAKKASHTMQAEFFKLNERKLEALIKATTNDMKKAETAILRMADDQYRKIIYNAQVYANTGAGTYEQAVDMATKDMLRSGLNCVEYANGARHTLKNYAKMAIRTASKRAYLQGEGTKRQEWGIYTVIMNKRGNPCPKCLPFCGKVLIDDVWSGGPKSGISPETGKKYPLMSKAIEAGLYHPNCKDSHTTYFEGISTPPDGKYTKEELENIEEQHRAEQKQQYAERQAEKFERLEKHSLDDENKKLYKNRVKHWEDEVERHEYEKISFVMMPDIKFSIKQGAHITNKQKFYDTMIATSAYSDLPIIIRQNLGDVIFEFGYDGSACDIYNKTIRIGKGASKEDVYHEMGHLIEHYMMDSADVRKYKEYLVESLSYNDIIKETYYDAVGNPVDIFLLKGNRFESEYQSRLYISKVTEALNPDGTINVDVLGEAISEPFRKYMNGEHISDEVKKLIEGAVL